MKKGTGKKRTRKKSRASLAVWAFWLCVAAGAAWLALAPTGKQPVGPQSSVTVHVDKPPLEKPSFGGEEKETAPQPVPPVDEQHEAAQLPAPMVPPAPAKMPEKPAAHGPEIAIIIDDVGVDIKGSERAINLIAPVTLSFLPYAVRLHDLTREAREHGHELMLHMPMEPMGHEDPGPGALLTSLPADEQRQRLEKALASFVGFDGINNHMGSRYTADADGMTMVMNELQPRHLFFLDSKTSAKSVGESLARQHKVPTISRDVFLDDEITVEAVIRQLDLTERLARKRGYAIAIGHPHQPTLEALEVWLPLAEKRGIKFVPVKELIGQ